MLTIHNEVLRLTQVEKYTTGYFHWSNMKRSDVTDGNFNVKSAPNLIGTHKFSLLTGSKPPVAEPGFLGIFMSLESTVPSGIRCILKSKVRINMRKTGDASIQHRHEVD